MAKKAATKKIVSKKTPLKVPAKGKTSALIDTRVIYCGDNLEQLKKLPENSDDPFSKNKSPKSWHECY